MIRPLETNYKGCRFRSRLEARWAVFFDEMGIKWEYEFQGFDLGGIYYLPDFWLPTFGGGMWAEVKPETFTLMERWKAERLVVGSGRPLWLCVGVPDLRVYEIIELCSGKLYSTTGIPLYDQAESENRMFVSPEIENLDGSIPPDYWHGMGMHIQAIGKARSARFDGDFA